ncbi:hypothetical protein GGD81_000341 [Rhodobium orientis]|uniref:hypothetical protein n=1 Tax=Rhodobium orientis TaxID=34017 RepID=UPI0011B941CB|nr:hypothetical protein [Rhodobium orientis]MBB4301326.1 hypothetical protein [Rhodobium orientis]
MDQQELIREIELQNLEYNNQREIQKQKDRAEISNQLIKGNLIINGGGAVSLLAFIQSLIDKNSPSNLLQWASLSIIAFCLGLASCGASNYLRVEVSHHDRDPDSKKKNRRISLSKFLQYFPIILFMIGCSLFSYAVMYEYSSPEISPTPAALPDGLPAPETN